MYKGLNPFMQLVRCHYKVGANWLLLQAFLEYHQPYRNHSSHGISQRSATGVTPEFSLWQVMFSELVSVFYWYSDPP
jgi:hypothetical protein